MVFEIIIAVLAFLLVMRVGLFFLRTVGQPPPPPPPPGELRRVSLRYRCPSCGVEVKLTTAPDEDPEPPRHCMEEMELLTPAD